MVEKLMYQQRHKEDTRPLAHHAMDLDKQMQEILSKNDLNEYDKAMLYMQSLNKYLGTIHSQDIPKIHDQTTNQLQQQQQQPQQHLQPQPLDPQPERKSVDVAEAKVSQPLSINKIIENIPKYSRTRGRKIVSILREDPDFQWDVNGQVTIEGKVIDGSDIRQIILNASSNPRRPFSPVGLDSVLHHISKKRNIPVDVITNRNWRKLLNIRDSQQTPLSRWLTPASPALSPSLAESRRNMHWESW
jgi:hypothetical protein